MFEPVVEVTVVAEEEEVAVLLFELVVEVTVVVVVVAFVVVPVVTVGVVVVLNGVVVVPVPVVVVVVVVANVGPMRRGKTDDRKMDRLMNIIKRLFSILIQEGRRWNDDDGTTETRRFETERRERYKMKSIDKVELRAKAPKEHAHDKSRPIDFYVDYLFVKRV